MTEHFRAALIVNKEVYDLCYLSFEEGCIVAVAINDQDTDAQEEVDHTVKAIKQATGHVCQSESP